MRLKNLSLLVLLPLFLISLVCFASANLLITPSSSTFTTNHSTVLSIPLTLTNIGLTNFTNITLSITNISNPSQFLPVTITDSSKRFIANGTWKDYTIDYPIPQYLTNGTYSVTINASANDSGTPVSNTTVITITVNETQNLEVYNIENFRLTQKTNKSNVLTIQNTGNVDLTISGLNQFAALRDSKNRTINLTMALIGNSLLTPGASVNANITAYAHSKMTSGTYSTTLQIITSEGYTKNVTLTFELATSFCDFGNVGNYFGINIKEPNDNDDFYPNDNIAITVKVTNNEGDDRDIVIAANLYDVTDGQFLDEEVSDSFTAIEDKSENFDITLTVPSDIDESHEYRVYVKVYDDDKGEKQQCTGYYVPIDIKRKTHDVSLKIIEAPSKIACGKTADITIKLSNIGKKDEDVRIRAYNEELGIDISKTLSIDFADSTETILSVSIPKNVNEGNYSLTIKVSYLDNNKNYIEVDGDSVSLNIQGSCIINSVILSAVAEQGYVNQQLAITVTLFNTGDSVETYTLVASDYESWASLNKIEPLSLTAGKGQSVSAIVYLTPKNVSGTQTFKVKAIYGNKITEKEVSVNVKEKSSVIGFWQNMSNKLSNYSGLDLATVNIILIIAIIILIFWIFRARRY